VLFSEDFYRTCQAHLAEGGVLVSQNAIPFGEQARLSLPKRKLRAVFADVACYRVAVPSFYGGEMTFAWASDDPAQPQVPLDELHVGFQRLEIKTLLYPGHPQPLLRGSRLSGRTDRVSRRLDHAGRTTVRMRTVAEQGL
jgi:spermidine synthase